MVGPQGFLAPWPDPASLSCLISVPCRSLAQTNFCSPELPSLPVPGAGTSVAGLQGSGSSLPRRSSMPDSPPGLEVPSDQAADPHCPVL